MNTDSTQPTPLIGNAESVEPDEAPTECFAEPDGDKAVLGTPTPDEEQTTYPDVDAIGVHEAPPQDTCEAAPDGTPPGDVSGVPDHTSGTAPGEAAAQGTTKRSGYQVSLDNEARILEALLKFH